MSRAYWLLTVLLLWVGVALVGLVLPGSSMSKTFTVLALQQGVLIIGGLKGISSVALLKVRVEDVLKGVFAGGSLFVINILASAAVIAALSVILGVDNTRDMLLQERTGVQSLINYASAGNVWLVALFVVVGASVSEELFFRGFLLDYLRTKTNAKGAVIISALCFALLHFYVIQFVPILVSGILLGLLFVRSGNLVRPVVAHAVVNGVVLFLALRI